MYSILISSLTDEEFNELMQTIAAFGFKPYTNSSRKTYLDVHPSYLRYTFDNLGYRYRIQLKDLNKVLVLWMLDPSIDIVKLKLASTLK